MALADFAGFGMRGKILVAMAREQMLNDSLKHRP